MSARRQTLGIEQHVPWLSLRSPLGAAGRVIALASWLGACLAGCDGPTEFQPRAGDAGNSPSQGEDTLLVDAQEALRLGDYAALPELIERLDLATATDPNDGPRVLYAALIRSWRMVEGIDHIPGYLPGDYGADHGIAIEYFLRARMLLPNDARVPGTHAIVFDPLSFISRLVALVPAPRFHLLRYAGILSPAAVNRAEVVSSLAQPVPPTAAYRFNRQKWCVSTAPFEGVAQVAGLTFDGALVWFASGTRLHGLDPSRRRSQP